MNVTTNKKPKTLKGFKGLYARGAYESCPDDHLTDCMNCIFPGSDQVSIRESFEQSSYIAGRTWVSYFIATVSGGACLLTLDASGNLRDETHNTTLATFYAAGAATADDFAGLNIFGRTYLCMKFRGKAMTGGVLYYFNGSTLTQCAGAGPSTAPTLTEPSSGIVDTGLHYVGVSFQSTDGYLSPPSPLASINASGSKNIHLASIPVGPAGTVARVLTMTLAAKTELFFVPGGTINDNTTTTADINVADTSLISSADYLNDLLTVIPAGSALRFYAGRLIIIGQYATPDVILASRVSDPESFDSVQGVINLPADYGINTTNSGFILRDVLYLTKPNGTYSTQDNGGEPATWTVSIIDSAVGAWDTGISLFASSMSAQDTMDSCFTLSKRGLMLFNGSYNSVPYTYKIDSIWHLLDATTFYLCQIAHDAWNKRVYISVPLANPSFVGTCSTSGFSVTRNSGDLFYPYMAGRQIVINGLPYLVYSYDGPNNLTLVYNAGTQASVGFTISAQGAKQFAVSGAANQIILMMDYSNGLDPMAVRWSTWSSLSFGTGIKKMSVENFTLSYVPGGQLIYQLSFCNGGPTIYRTSIFPYQLEQIPTTKYVGDCNPTGVALYPINQYIISPVIKFGGVSVFTRFDLSVSGWGNLCMYLWNKDRTGSQVAANCVILRTFQLDAYYGQDLSRLINFTNEGMQIQLQCDQTQTSSYNGFFLLDGMEVYGQQAWGMRPSYNQTS